MLKTKKLKKISMSSLAVVCAACLTFGAAYSTKSTGSSLSASASESITKLNTSKINTDLSEYYDGTVVSLPETVDDDDYISLIISLNEQTVMEAYSASDYRGTLQTYVRTTQAQTVSGNIEKTSAKLLKALTAAGIEYTEGEKYDTILSGFEIIVKASDFYDVNSIVGDDGTVIVGEEYNPCETEVVTNDVDVYDTGIFKSDGVDYDGSGVVVAVLDTGCDYTHTAFSTDNFSSDDLAFTTNTVSSVLSRTTAAENTSGLTVSDVYVSDKIPFAYDYADKDSDVAPINSEHGTHVAGIIAGKDDTITGVAPNAQLAIMKVFSDTRDGAKTSWILDALEDCVILGVDVINMSLGTSCGFAREEDEDRVNEIYDSIEEAGISLICAASNDYNATHASEKNGSLGLTSNPDSGTVGSPSTYSAALSVASVDGVKTPYIKYGDEIIYFKEATAEDAKENDFVENLISKYEEEHDTSIGTQALTLEYVTISGVGRASDYIDEDYTDKIVLVKRGTTTFEEKIRVALSKGALGIIIYNNVSGDISMSIGANVGAAACSISQDEGEMLAEAGTGKITVSRSQVAGPFMSDFSSWGPTSDLQIKPEITAHGGEIYSCVPGQSYDTLSGTSMAAPNQAGATALIRQYVKANASKFGVQTNGTTDNKKVTARVNQLMMSTADIVYNKNGLAYSVRKQGAGLMNIAAAAASPAYVTTYKNGEAMDKTKIELGDDPDKTGVYEMTFDINNVSNEAVSYDVSAIVMSEGVSSTYTSHGDTTVTENGALLDSTIVVKSDGKAVDSDIVTVGAGKSVSVTVTITLSDSAKSYLDESFAYGMYVEGFITLTQQTTGTAVDMSVPYLAFYGDWTEAPIFDEEYYDTNADEINDGIDDEDKLMADAYATRVWGKTYSDYGMILGTYAFSQDPSLTQIAADKNKIAISNYETGDSGAAVNTLEGVWAGLLRNCKKVDISIVEDSTGEEVFSRTETNQRKSYSSGSTVYSSSIDIEFSALENELKNNTQYTVTLTAYIDYGDGGASSNVRNTFTFPLYIDFEAPVVTDVEYRTEYDKTTKKTKLYADISVYDNHYTMAMMIGQIVESTDENYSFSLSSFGKYLTPVYSSFNSTSKVTVELTDYINDIKNSRGLTFDSEGNYSIEENNNCFIISCYDYALNSATYEISLPDEVVAMCFARNGEEVESISLSPNETLDLTTALNVYPTETWAYALDFTSSNEEVAYIVNGTLLAKASGEAYVYAEGKNADGETVKATLHVKVLAEGDEGYQSYDVPQINKFSLTSYTTNKAYYSVSSDERKIGITGGTYDFGSSYSLEMYPSENVTVHWVLYSYFPESTKVKFSVGNKKIAEVSEDGTITALAEGSTTVTATVYFNDKSTIYSQRISITVNDPYTINSIYLMSYKGLGGVVEIPDDRGITTIYSYAFANYEYVSKDLSAGDVIDDEDPYSIKQQYIGESTITKIIIPAGVKEIQSYAFANLTGLEEVVLPSTLTKIGVGAFYGCTSLKKINLENVQFINQQAFYNCALESVTFNKVVAIGNYTFANNKLTKLVLPSTAQSLGTAAFYNNTDMASITIGASKIKISSYVFAGCTSLISIDINAAVISDHAFYGCTSLKNVTLGKDVAEIGEFAFASTAVEKFTVQSGNSVLKTANGDTEIRDKTTDTLILVAPATTGYVTTDATEIDSGAYAGNTNITKVIAKNATKVGAYAFAGCTNLTIVDMPELKEVGDYAFYGTGVQTISFDNVETIGSYAFMGSDLKTVTLGDNVTIGDYAFYYCTSLKSVELGDNATIGIAAFASYLPTYTYDYTSNSNVFSYYYTSYKYYIKDENGKTVQELTYYRYNIASVSSSSLESVKVGDNAQIGEYAFANSVRLKTLEFGDGAVIGDQAFINATALTSVDLSKVKTVGEYAFSGTITYDYWIYSTDTSSSSYTYTKAVNYSYDTASDVYSATAYVTTSFSASIESVDLSGATEIGTGAFAYNSALTTVNFGSITKVPDYAFARCSSLKTLAMTGITEVGDYAFSGAAITSVDVSKVNVIGDYAFYGCDLTAITLTADGADIGDYAFASNENLAEVANLDKAENIGAYAFCATALTSLDLSSAKTIGDYAFASSNVTEVKFGTALTDIGENPFYECEITTYGKYGTDTFGSTSLSVLTETYEISDTVQVIDGVLYKTVANGGLALVSYPACKSGTSYTVEEGTVRISARAFGGAELENVVLASTLKAIGDKAFYGCGNLSSVVFLSYDAPILEEEYSASYATYENLPFAGRFYTYEGLGISKYYMWNVTSSTNNFYYGSNFVDYIGHIGDNIAMVKPANGQNYDSFILSQYFNTVIDGSNAMTEDTVKVVALIAALPTGTEISLDSKTQVEEARAAYDALSSLEQKALVTNYSMLTDAEETIEYLETKNSGNDTPETPDTPSDEGDNTGLIIGLSVASGVLLIAVIVLLVFVFRKKSAPSVKADGTAGEIEDENDKKD